MENSCKTGYATIMEYPDASYVGKKGKVIADAITSVGTKVVVLDVNDVNICLHESQVCYETCIGTTKKIEGLVDLAGYRNVNATAEFVSDRYGNQLVVHLPENMPSGAMHCIKFQYDLPNMEYVEEC